MTAPAEQLTDAGRRHLHLIGPPGWHTGSVAATTSQSARISTEIAALYVGVSQTTIHSWVHRGHITRYSDGLDMDEIDAWTARRRDTKIRRRAAA